MEKYEKWIIKDYDVEFIDVSHTYLVNGVIVPSITTILKNKFSNKYNGIPKNVLRRASELGTQMHLAIQQYEEQNIDCDLKELKNYKFLKRQYKWTCIENEKPVILFMDNKPIACGRIDMIGSINNEMGLFDFKRTSVLDKDYLGYQLNLYRIAYQQSYGTEIEFLRGIHLREDVRKFVKIPINEELTLKLIEEWREQNESI